jgi:hypothetical protein
MTNNFKLHKTQTTPLNEKCSNSSLDLNLIQLPRHKKQPTRKVKCTLEGLFDVGSSNINFKCPYSSDLIKSLSLLKDKQRSFAKC